MTCANHSYSEAINKKNIVSCKLQYDNNTQQVVVTFFFQGHNIDFRVQMVSVCVC